MRGGNFASKKLKEFLRLAVFIRAERYATEVACRMSSQCRILVQHQVYVMWPGGEECSCMLTDGASVPSLITSKEAGKCCYYLIRQHVSSYMCPATFSWAISGLLDIIFLRCNLIKMEISQAFNLKHIALGTGYTTGKQTKL